MQQKSKWTIDQKDVLIAVFAIGTAWGSYQAGQTSAEERMLRIEKRLGDKATQLGDIAGRVELLCEADERCARRYPPINGGE